MSDHGRMTSNSSPDQDAVDGRIKIWFRFTPRENWMEIDTEGLWATVLSEDTARVDNVPFLQDGLAQGDIVRFSTNDDGVHRAVGRVASSGHCTILVLSEPEGPLGRGAQPVHERFEPFGLGGEVYSDDFPLVAFDVPPDADLAGIKALLERGRVEGWWHYEAGCVTDAWNAA